ncbi:serine hydrolase domain-containing protein [Facklamia languida]
MKRLIVFFTSVLLLSHIGADGTIHALEQEEIGQEVAAFIEERKEGTAAVSLGVFQRGAPVYQTHYGFIDREGQIAADENSIYEWGSVSKVLVWVALMQLQESGQIDLNEDIKTYLPEDFSAKLTYPDPVRVLDIMNLQTGFQEVGLKVEYAENEVIPDLGDLLIDSQPDQVFKPGGVTAYNNWTPALAAYLVESVSGQSFHAYVQANIFEPLGMDHTAVAADWQDNLYVKEHRRQSKSYYYTSEDKESLGSCITHIGLYPAGATAGTFDDFLTFAMEFTRSHPRFFKKAETFDRMKEASVFYEDGRARTHHGLLAFDHAVHLIGHSGNTQGYTSSFWFNPITETGYAVMTNEPGETAYNYGLAQLLYGSGEGTPQKGSNISGLYTSQRSIHRGSLRFIKYLAGILPIQQTEDASLFRVPLADLQVTSIGNHHYQFDNGNGFAYQVVERGDGHVLEDFSTDRVRLSLSECILAYGLIIGLLISLVVTMIRVVIRLIRRLRGKAQAITSGLISQIAGLIVGLAFLYLWLMTSDYTRLKLCVISLICVLASSVTIVIFCKELYNKFKGRSHASLISVSWPLLAPVFVYFFELYNFWS